MRIIGLTGGIASGKSTVTRMLRQLGARVVDIDAIARQVVAPGEPAWQEVVDWLGRPYLLADGNLDRRRVADLVFADDKARARLEAITHPRIGEAVDREVAAAKADGLPAVVLDVPLLFEAGWVDRVDEVWVVYASEEDRLTRLQERDNLSRQAAEARMIAQLSLDEKVRQATVVIDNSKDLESTGRQVAAAWRELTAAGE
jgi:dephospho-CoA kinase